MRLIRSFVLLLVTLALSAGLASAQSLAEVAKKEKQRRTSNASDSKTVITDRELTRSYGGLPTTLPSSTSTAAGETEAATSESESQDDDGEAQDETRTEAYWQGRVAGAKEKIARLEQEVNSDDWGEGQRFGVDPMGQNNLSRRQQSEQELTAARAELEAIRAEARRAGVPPGWVR
jgi:hypothetical protein